jgi:hypothetical protein
MCGGNPPNIPTHVYKSFGGFLCQSVTSHLTENIYLPAIPVPVFFTLKFIKGLEVGMDRKSLQYYESVERTS